MVLTDYQKLGILMGDSDIKVLEEFVLLLEPFYDATLSLRKRVLHSRILSVKSMVWWNT
jgi:hypothetical protein